MSALRTSTMSPLFKARMGGFCWLMCFLTSIYPVMISGRLIVAGDPATTAANLLANEPLFRLGTASLLVSTAFYVGVLRSRYVPRALAALGIFSSLLLAVGSLAIIAFPALGAIGMSYMMPMGLYEVGLGFWLLIKGIKVPSTIRRRAEGTASSGI